MTTRANFLASILAEPDVDLHRVAYADWLDEEARPPEPEYAEFIRLQCELATIDRRRRENAGPGGIEYVRSLVRGLNDPPPDHPVVVEDRRLLDLSATLRRRERELEPHVSEWFSESVWHGFELVVVSPNSASPEDAPLGLLHRGFICKVWLSWQDCLAQLDSILRVQPVRKVVLTTVPDSHAAGWWMPVNDMSKMYHRRWPGVEFELPSSRKPVEVSTVPIDANVIRPLRGPYPDASQWRR